MSRVSALLDQAQRATNLSDFGEDTFREGLEVLVASADAEAKLNDRGRAALDYQVVDLLSRRLEIEHWYSRHPEIDEQEITAPLIGLGLPRTGSTALSCLLAEDPAVRSIRTWESQAPCPPPETATEHTDPRIAEAARRQALVDQMSPRFRAMLPMSPTAPMECQNFMGYDFKSQTFQAVVRIPRYSEWLNNEADLVPTYRYVKRVLKLLQWRCPPYRWRLKNPSHMLFIDALDEVFPDARYWMTHRAIDSVIPSVVDLYNELSRPNSDVEDVGYLADLNMGCWELGLRRTLAFRDRGADQRFFDVQFAEFQADPFPTMERLYAFLGEPFTEETRSRMAAWRRDNARDKHGRHDYDLAAMGLDRDELKTKFRFYETRYGLAEPVA